MADKGKDEVVKNEAYFVLTGEGDAGATKILFKPEDAFASGEDYIDVFDKTGNKIAVYQFIEGTYIPMDF